MAQLLIAQNAPVDTDTSLARYTAIFNDGPEINEKGKPQKIRNRKLYPSDEMYCNFREVYTTGMAPHTLYRSATPLLVSNSRGQKTLALVQKYGIYVVLDLSDSKKRFAELVPNAPYYYDIYQHNRATSFAMEIPVDHFSTDFKEIVREALIFLSEQPKGPYLIHCNEGKDRSGVVCAIIEALIGASLQEIKDDYCLSFNMYYHYGPGSSWYTEREQVIENFFIDVNRGLPVDTIDLQALIEDYLLTTIKLTPTQLITLKANLTKNNTGD